MTAEAGAVADGRAAGQLRVLLVVVAAVAVPALAFGVGFPQRTDYLGHFLAGAGGTALLFAPVVAVVGVRPWLSVVVTVVAILCGVFTEATVFRIAIFDPVDLGIQSLGAVIVGCAVLGTRRSLLLGAGLLAISLALLFVGFDRAFA